ncbi:MAG TPA: cytochrome P450 [Solirubrobacteraceae bacterium]|nr:cytochrome P450 [Solirubrobacteraceae bacterium]
MTENHARNIDTSAPTDRSPAESDRAIEQAPAKNALADRALGRHAIFVDTRLPPGPRLPSTLQALAWTWRSLPFMERCRERYGDIFTLRVRHGGTWVLLSAPEDVKRVFTADPNRLGVGEANTLLGPVLGPRSVMLLEEPQHMTRRRLMLPSFHGRLAERYGGMICEVTREAIATWPRGRPFELWPRMQQITLEAVMRVVFGPLCSGSLLSLRGLLRELTDRMNAPRRLALLAALGPRSMVGDPGFRRTLRAVEAAVLEEIRKRRAQATAGGEVDIASLLARAHYEDGAPMSTRDLRDELVTLLLDGPTSTSLAWVFERLLRHPDKLARLREEVARAETDAYLDAVVRETLRLCPPVPIVVRKLLTPMQLGGYTVPAGTMVAPCIHLVHRREDVYPRPRSFLPERFLQRPPGTYTWLPFGGGARRCLAASFALLEMKRVTATVLEEVALRAVQSRSEQVKKSAISYSPGRRGLVIVAGPGSRRRAQATTCPTRAREAAVA